MYNAALLEATKVYNWEQLETTDLTAEQAAAEAFTIYENWLEGSCSLDCNDVLACLATVFYDLQRDGMINPNSVDPTDTTVIETRFPTTVRNQPILAAPDPCDLDTVWAGIYEIVKRIDGNGRDFWQTIVAETDTVERIAEIIALVPLFGDILGEGLALLAEIAPDMLNQYESYSSTAQLESIACNIFQTVCYDCRFPTHQELFDYFAGRSDLGAAAWEEIALDAIFDILLGTDGKSDAIVWYTTNILQMWVLAAGASFIKAVGPKFIEIWATVGAAVPSHAWAALCGSCGGNTWSHDFDFTIDAQGWNIRSGQGTWTSSGIAGTQIGSQYILQVNKAWGGPYNITNMVAHFTSTNINQGNFSCGMRDTPSGTAYDFIVSKTAIYTEPYDLTYEGDVDRTGPLIFVFGANYNAQIYLTSIHIEGEGEDPWS